MCLKSRIVYNGLSFYYLSALVTIHQGIPRDEMANIQDIVVNEFELQLRYYVHFQTITLKENCNLFILPPSVEEWVFL